MRSSVRSDARSDMGSLASEGSQLDWQRPPEAEVVEQPNASRKVKVTVCEAWKWTGRGLKMLTVLNIAGRSKV